MTGGSRGLDDGARLGRRGGERLLDQNVLSGFDGEYGQLGVGVVGCGDLHGADGVDHGHPESRRLEPFAVGQHGGPLGTPFHDDLPRAEGRDGPRERPVVYVSADEQLELLLATEHVRRPAAIRR
jgi:hypothetical protein